MSSSKAAEHRPSLVRLPRLGAVSQMCKAVLSLAEEWNVQLSMLQSTCIAVAQNVLY